MISFKAEKIPYRIECDADSSNCIFPYVRKDTGLYSIQCISPIHGRSFVLCAEKNGQWIIGKGNGLSYTTHSFVLTSPIFAETWGGLSLDNAVRDFNIGNEVRSLGIKTNLMQYVLSIDANIIKNGEKCQAALLQYSVECPYRITDFGFIPKHILKRTIAKWGNKYQQKHLHAAFVLVNNLRILHEHKVLHNAMHPQNYTWALELLDFEASRSIKYPYNNTEYEAYVPMLSEAEVIQTYEIINYIAWCLGEKPNYIAIENIFRDNGFRLKELQLKAGALSIGN